MNNQNNSDTKRKEELHIANEFLSLKNISAVCLSGEDPPDITIKIEDIKIGLEITRLCIEKSVKKTSPLDTLIKKVTLEYAKRYPNSKYYLEVSLKKFNFNKHQLSQIIDDMISELKSFIEDSINPKTYFSNIKIVPVITSSLKIFHLYEEAGYMFTISDNIIKEAVFKKEADVHLYKKDYKEIWLLLIIPLYDYISAGYYISNINDDQISQIHDSEFDHIFIMRNRQVQQLR